jgi:hypothetical protein
MRKVIVHSEVHGSTCCSHDMRAGLPEQDHLEAILFNVMHMRGFGDEHVSRYRLVTKFFQQRRPLIVLICGVPCTGARCRCMPPAMHAMLLPCMQCCGSTRMRHAGSTWALLAEQTRHMMPVSNGMARGCVCAGNGQS